MITYIDMDGVLADFYQGAHDWMGIKVDGFPYKSGYDWPTEMGCDYENYPSEFWANLPLHKDMKRLIVMAKGRKIIATCPCGINSLIGKSIWAEKHFPHLELIFIREKRLLSNNNCWLIDDSREQIENFNKYGGTGILVPRPWNAEEI